MTTDQTQAQLDAYYNLNLQHLRWSFWSSLASLAVGLAVLLIGITLIFRGDIGLMSQLTTIGGVLTQFVAAGFFFLYSRNLKQLNVFYDKLVKHKDTLHAINLANSLGDAERSSAMLAVLGSLLSRGEPPISPDVLKAAILRGASRNDA